MSPLVAIAIPSKTRHNYRLAAGEKGKAEGPGTEIAPEATTVPNRPLSEGEKTRASMGNDHELPNETIGTGAGGSSPSSSVSPPEEDIKIRRRLRTDDSARGCLSLRAAAGGAESGDPSPSTSRTSRAAAQDSEGRPTSSETTVSDSLRTLPPAKALASLPPYRSEYNKQGRLGGLTGKHSDGRPRRNNLLTERKVSPVG